MHVLDDRMCADWLRTTRKLFESHQVTIP